MKQPAFRFMVSCLTFLIGIVSNTVFVRYEQPFASSTSGQTLFVNTPQMYAQPKAVPDLFEKIGNVPATREYTYNRIQFVSENVGWFKADEKLWRTRDGGNSWKLIYDAGYKKQPYTDNYPDSIYDFQFINSRVGWLLKDGKMKKTEDGGDRWESFANELLTQLDEWPPLTFKFLPDGKHGWLAGGMYRSLEDCENVANRYVSSDGKKGLCGAIFSTEDGGRTWRKQLLSGGGHIGEIFALDAEHAWAVGTSGSYYLKDGIWRATDSAAWNEKDELVVGSLDIAIGAPTHSPTAVFFVNPKLGWLSNSNGYVAKSADGGRTWRDILNLFDYPESENFAFFCFNKLYFSDKENGWALDSKGDIYRTYDGGARWTKIETGLGFSDMYFLDAQHGWAISKDGLYRIGNF